MTTNIYIIRLKGGRYYVGKSDNVSKRYEQHLNGKGSSWTKDYPPITLEKIIENASPFEEDKITKEYMAKYGIDKVRGGSYVQKELSDFQIETLKLEIWAANNLCTQCGRSNHFAKNCYAKTDVFGNKIEYGSDDDSDGDIGESEDDEEDDEKCYRCGRQGHYKSECYASKHIKGYYLS